MELLDYAEQQGQEAAKFSLATLERARARCHQFLVLLLGGAGAFAGVGLTQWGAHRWVGAAALAVALLAGVEVGAAHAVTNTVLLPRASLHRFSSFKRPYT